MALTLKAVTTRLGYQQITSLSAATGLTVPQTDLNGLNARPSIALITPETQAVRWRDDDVNPTASVGMPLAAGVTLQRVEIRRRVFISCSCLVDCSDAGQPALSGSPATLA